MYGNSSHIPQPPHTAGVPFSGLRARIDPEQIPSPIDAVEADEQTWDGRTYATLPGGTVPLASSNYVAVDQGNSTPRLIRMTTWNMPSTSDLAHSCQIPLAAIIQPFSPKHILEDDVPLVETFKDDVNPPRCAGCGGYINPWCTWESGGNKWRCNMCKHLTDVAPEYFCQLDENFLRRDHFQRPELHKGTVDVLAPTSYYAPPPPPRITPSYYTPSPLPPVSLDNPGRPPVPLHLLFAIDVSINAIRCGITKAACDCIKAAISGRITKDGIGLPGVIPEGCKVAVVAFDDTLHFHRFPSEIGPAEIFVVPDLEDVFCPLNDRMFVDPAVNKVAIEALLDAIPERYETTIVGTSALGPMIRASMAALHRTAGHVILFTSTLPTAGPGSLPPEGEKAHLGFRDTFWRELGDELIEEGVALSVFAGSAGGTTGYIDIGSIGSVASMTGGETHYYPRFDYHRDLHYMQSHLCNLLDSTEGYNCSIRVRCSTALRVSAYHGPLHYSSSDSPPLPLLTQNTTFLASFVHTAGMISSTISSLASLASSASAQFATSTTFDERDLAHIQCAVLYTHAATGQRRVRVLNLAVQVAALAGNVFRYADLDATASYISKEAMILAQSQDLADVREGMTEKCSSILLAYRKNCAAATAPSQLILPEAYKLLPLYLLGVQKNRSIRGHNVPLDVRNFYAQRLLSMPVLTMLRHLYPRVLAVHDLTPDAVFPLLSPPPEQLPLESEEGRLWKSIAEAELVAKFESTLRLGPGEVKMPSLMRGTHTGMTANGIYIADNEETTVLWLGSEVSPQLLYDLFGVDSLNMVDARMLPTLPTHFSSQIHTILSRRRAERHGADNRFFVARQSMDGAELEFSDMLAEDRNCGAMSYIDYLCYVHKQINTALTNGTTIGNGSFSLRGSPW